MFQRQRNWWTEVIWKPKKAHSLEQLRYHHYILTKNAIITDQNRALLVETLRSIAEILIWGDQNDSTVFDFFLEKNMLLFFLTILNQNPETYVCVQLLQTLNILFENIRHETSLYYLLSNNHVNAIIIHKFDFSNEEILAYYISFLKTLSLKLNRHVINFFFNERKSDFALYTEALKFFDHKENMVRIAVRTLTLNVYKLNVKPMLNFIANKTADPYFCNLIWFIGNHAMVLQKCSVTESDHLHCQRLKDLVADHLDHLHYVNDILCLNIVELNEILTEYLLDRLIIPLYIYSLAREEDNTEEKKTSISKLICVYILSQIFLIMRHPPLMSTLADVIFQGEEVEVTNPQTESPVLSKKLWELIISQENVRRRQPKKVAWERICYNGNLITAISMLSLVDSGLVKNGVANDLRTFAAPEGTLEESLLASGINNEGYTITNRLSELTRQRSRRVANSKFYVKERRSQGRQKKPDEERQRARREDRSPSPAVLDSLQGRLGNSHPVPMNDTPLGQVTGDDDDGDGLMVPNVKQTLNEVKGLTTEESAIPNNVRVPNYGSPVAMSLLVRPKDFQPSRTYFNTLIKSLDCSDDDREALFTLCLFYSLIKNRGVDPELLRAIGIFPGQTTEHYSDKLIEALIKIMEQASKHENKVRLVTLQMSIILLKQLVYSGHPGHTILKDFHFALLEDVRESSTLELRNYYKSDDIFLDVFEGEYRQIKVKPLNVEHLMMDASLLLPATATPLTGIKFSKRLACGEDEHTQRAARVFLMVRELSLTVRREPERQLPLSKVEYSVKENEVLDLNNSDLISCTIVEENSTLRRFLVIDEAQFILVEPDTTRLGWGVVKFVALLQDVEISPAKDDSRSLFITIHQPFARSTRVLMRPIMSAKFMFDDYIRCMSAKQRLHRRRTSLRHIKLQRIAQLLELPMLATSLQPSYSVSSSYMQMSGVSPQVFRSRPGGAVPVPSPVHPVTSSLTTEESSCVSRAPVGKDTSSAVIHENSCVQSDPGDYHRMAAPESCLHPSQASGEQARALASVLANESDDDSSTFDKLDALDISDQRKSDEEANEVIEEASDVLDAETWNNIAVDDTAAGRGARAVKCPSAPSTPRGQRRFKNSTFHVVEWTVGDLTMRNAMSEPSLILE